MRFVQIHTRELDEPGRSASWRTIRTGAAVFATNSPVNDKITIHTKQVPYRTYAIAGRVPKGGVPDALVWDTCDPYHYVRIQPLSDSEDLIVVGGEDHHSGEASDMDRRLAQLQDWTRERYPGFTAAQYRWSGQVLEPIDFLPFSGATPETGTSTSIPAIPAKGSPMASQEASPSCR